MSVVSVWFMLTFVSLKSDSICLDQKPPDEAANVGATRSSFCSMDFAIQLLKTI